MSEAPADRGTHGRADRPRSDRHLAPAKQVQEQELSRRHQPYGAGVARIGVSERMRREASAESFSHQHTVNSVALEGARGERSGKGDPHFASVPRFASRSGDTDGSPGADRIRVPHREESCRRPRSLERRSDAARAVGQRRDNNPRCSPSTTAGAVAGTGATGAGAAPSTTAGGRARVAGAAGTALPTAVARAGAAGAAGAAPLPTQ